MNATQTVIETNGYVVVAPDGSLATNGQLDGPVQIFPTVEAAEERADELDAVREGYTIAPLRTLRVMPYHTKVGLSPVDFKSRINDLKLSEEGRQVLRETFSSVLRVKDLISELETRPSNDFVFIGDITGNQTAAAWRVLDGKCYVDPTHPENPKTISGKYHGDFPESVPVGKESNVTLIVSSTD